MGGTTNQSSRTTKWAVQVSYFYNGHRSSTTLKGLSAPIESEIIKALYDYHGHTSSNKFEIIEIYNKWTYTE